MGLVKHVYFVDEYFLEELALKSKKSDFFSSSLKFYQSVKDKEVSALSEKQLKWLRTLKEIMDKKELEKVKKQIPLHFVRKIKKFTLWPKKTDRGWVWLTYYE